MYGDGRPRGRAALPLHGGNPVWSHANHHIDLWVELLHAWGLDPLAALPFAVAQDFEADQFTLATFPQGDLERLYGIACCELSTYDRLEAHIAAQTGRGNVVLLEVDSFYLPQSVNAYRRHHARSYIGIDVLVPEACAMGYFHGDGYHTASGDDYAAILHRAAIPFDSRERQAMIMPRAQVVRRRLPPQDEAALLRISLELLRHYLARRPRANPITTFRAAFPRHLEQLMGRGEPAFQVYAASVLRQLGANFEMLGRYLRWLAAHGEPVPEPIREACQTMASEAMVMQFRLMRAVISRKPDACVDCLDQLELTWEGTAPALASYFGEQAS